MAAAGRGGFAMRFLSILLLTTISANAQGAPVEFRRGWTEEERVAIERYYEPISPLTRSSHWHDYDCCQSNRCFPARPGSVRWTPDGYAISLPDGSVVLHGEHEPIWKARQGAGVNDPRAHVCLEREADGSWFVVCAYKPGVGY